MLLNDALQHFRGTGVIPDTLGINDGDRTALTNAQAIGFGAEHQRLRTDEVEFLEATFEKFPGHNPLLFRATLRFGLVSAQEDVAAEFLEAEFLNFKLKQIAHAARRFDRSQFLGMHHEMRDTRQQPPRRAAVQHAMIETQREMRFGHRHKLLFLFVPAH